MEDQAGDPLKPKYRRVVLKVSGEAFGTPGRSGINIDETLDLARQVQRGVQLAVVVGAGNILRGAQFSAGGETITKGTAHYMGMLATVLNGLALQGALENLQCETRLLTAIRMETVAEPYIRRRASRHLDKGRVVILAGGTGTPFPRSQTPVWERLPRNSVSRPVPWPDAKQEFRTFAFPNRSLGTRTTRAKLSAGSGKGRY